MLAVLVVVEISQGRYLKELLAQPHVQTLYDRNASLDVATFDVSLWIS